jgi:hypothetical protein
MKKVSEIFTVMSGSKLDFGKMTLSDSGIAFVSRSSKNNGIVGFVEPVDGAKKFDSGSITVTLGGTYVLSAFVQPVDFYTAQNVAVLIPKAEMPLPQKLYYCHCLSMNRYKYNAFGREANRTLKDVLIPAIADLPKYTEDVSLSVFSNMSLPLNNNALNLDVSKWMPFRYDELFDIERGTGPRKQDIQKGSTPFVTSSDINNGVSELCDFVPTHKGNTITVTRNGSVAEAFYQESAFCSTEDVHVFNPKFELNNYIAMFIITLIRKEKYRYSYGRKWGIERMNNSIIKLPASKDGTPDYEYMERYIKSLPYSSSI